MQKYVACKACDSPKNEKCGKLCYQKDAHDRHVKVNPAPRLPDVVHDSENTAFFDIVGTIRDVLLAFIRKGHPQIDRLLLYENNGTQAELVQDLTAFDLSQLQGKSNGEKMARLVERVEKNMQMPPRNSDCPSAGAIS